SRSPASDPGASLPIPSSPQDRFDLAAPLLEDSGACPGPLSRLEVLAAPGRAGRALPGQAQVEAADRDLIRNHEEQRKGALVPDARRPEIRSQQGAVSQSFETMGLADQLA